MSEPLTWSYRTTEIPQAGLREDRTATEAENSKVAAELEIVSCERLTSDFAIRAVGHGRYRLSGKVTAQLTQSCVVTLDPIAQSVDGSFDVEFWPTGKLPESGEEEVEALSAAEIEPIEHGQIDAGRIIFETLSASVDPYPRKPGAEFKGAELGDVAAATETGPFAALNKLKDRS
jgi:uncharacterized metal-binding protein YceD (DUF177 family)